MDSLQRITGPVIPDIADLQAIHRQRRADGTDGIIGYGVGGGFIQAQTARENVHGGQILHVNAHTENPEEIVEYLIKNGHIVNGIKKNKIGLEEYYIELMSKKEEA